MSCSNKAQKTYMYHVGGGGGGGNAPMTRTNLLLKEKGLFYILIPFISVPQTSCLLLCIRVITLKGWTGARQSAVAVAAIIKHEKGSLSLSMVYLHLDLHNTLAINYI